MLYNLCIQLTVFTLRDNSTYIQWFLIQKLSLTFITKTHKPMGYNRYLIMFTREEWVEDLVHARKKCDSLENY